MEPVWYLSFFGKGAGWYNVYHELNIIQNTLFSPVVTANLLVVTGLPVSKGIKAELHVIGTDDVVCQNPIQTQHPYVYGATGGFVENNKLVCGGNNSNTCMSLFGDQEPILMNYMRPYSSSIVTKDKVSS